MRTNYPRMKKRETENRRTLWLAERQLASVDLKKP
jgi:hypothetical protein